MTVLEGTYTGFWSAPYTQGRSYTVEYPGPEPYTKTVESVTTFVARALEEIEIGARVRVTVEEIE